MPRVWQVLLRNLCYATGQQQSLLKMCEELAMIPWLRSHSNKSLYAALLNSQVCMKSKHATSRFRPNTTSVVLINLASWIYHSNIELQTAMFADLSRSIHGYGSRDREKGIDW